jgi:DNA-binding beta-propeller fold protein YncE
MTKLIGARLALGLVLTMAGATAVSAGSLIVSANDGKAAMVNGAYKVDDPPLGDTLAVIDAASFPAKLLGQVAVEHSVAAPPFAVALSPDEKLALVGAANKVDPADKTRLVVDKFIQVIDVATRPPRLVERVTLPHQPIGVSINRQGDLALVAHFEGEVSVLSINGTTVKLLETLRIGDEKSRVSHVAFTPDGKFALATRRNDNVVAVLQIDNGKVADTKRDITVGNNPYGIDIAPNGTWAAVSNIGRGSGDNDSVTLIDLTHQRFRAVSYVAVPPTPEGIAISPDSEYLAVSTINGTNKPKDSPLFSDAGKLEVFAVRDATPTKVAEAPTGHNAQGVIFAGDSRHLIVQNYMEQELAVYAFADGALRDTGERIKLPARPAAIRAAAR